MPVKSHRNGTESRETGLGGVFPISADKNALRGQNDESYKGISHSLGADGCRSCDPYSPYRHNCGGFVHVSITETAYGAKLEPFCDGCGGRDAEF